MKPPVFNHQQYTDLEADYMILKAENERLKVENSEWELDNEQLRSELAATQKILDAAVEDLKRVPGVWPCYACKHTGKISDKCNKDNRECFEWRGLKGDAK